MSKLGTATSETHTRPHFASHTQSSLIKRQMPIKSNKKSSSSMKDMDVLKRSQRNVILRSSGIHKRQSNIMKQSRSMQMMIMILKQRDRRATIFLPGSELTTYRLEKSFVSLQSNLIKDVSSDLKKCVDSSAELTTLRGKSSKVNESENRVENSHTSQDETNHIERDNSEIIRISSEDHATVDVACKLQLPGNSRCEVEVLHHGIESERKSSDFPNKDCSKIETQVRLPDVNPATNRKHARKIWTAYGKGGPWNEHVVAPITCYTDVPNFKSAKRIGNPQDNCSSNEKVVNGSSRRKDVFQKNFASNQRAWRPSGPSKTCTVESATSLQSQKLTEKSTASSKNKYSSTKHVETLKSESTSTSISANQSKTLMKENRDPRANRMTKICEHLAETKQRQRLQSGGTSSKKQRSRTKIDTKVLDKHDTNPILSKSRRCQTQSIIPNEFSNKSNVEQHRTESTLTYKKSKTLEVIHTVKKISDSVREDNDVKENAVNKDFDHEKDDSEIQMSLNRATFSQNNKLLRIFAKDLNLNGANYTTQRSISTQTELDPSSYKKIDVEKDQEPKEILKLTRIVATQTSPSCNRNVVEIGCNTSNVVYEDVEVSCDLIDFTNLKTQIGSARIVDKLTLNNPIHAESLSVKCKINIEDVNENKGLPLSECKEILNTEMTTKLRNDSVEILKAKTTNGTEAVEEAEKIMYAKARHISLKSSENSNDKINTDIDKHREFTKCSNNYANSTSINNLFLARSRPSIDDASCSSEEITEYTGNDVQYEDMVTSQLKVENIPSDVIATFELAAERARNLREAVIIHYKNLMLKEEEKRNEETDEDCKTSEFRDDRHCLGAYTSFISRENEDKIRSECEAIYRFVNNSEDFGGFSTCSSCGSSCTRICEFESSARSLKDNFKIEQEEDAIFSENEQAIARSSLNECSDLENMKSVMQLLMHRTQEKYALELLGENGSDESLEMEEANKTLALSAIKKTYLTSRENLLPLVCCVVCTVVFWFLQFSFRYDSTK